MTNPLVQQLFFLNSKDGAFLSVPPALKGKISVEDVREELLRKRIVNADYDRIAEVLARASGDLEWIGERFQRFDPRKNKYIHVRISDDGVYAYLSVRFPRREEQQITAGDLEYKLWESSIRVPIDREKIRKIAAEKKNVVNEVVAAGTPPVHGEDGKLIFHVKVENDPKPLILEDGRVDFHRIDSIRLVKKDQLLVTRIPPKEGKPGTNVFGEPIPYIPGGDVKLPRGLNTYVSPDETKLFAKIDGHLYTQDGLLHVERVYVVRNDVDFSTGDIHYIGDVIVNGDVKTGFTVETEGNILVRGNVDGAYIRSRKGNIIIEGGVFGKNKAVLKAAGDIKAEFIQHAKIEAGGDVEVKKYVLACELDCRGLIRIPNGSIIGGHLKSDQGIIAGEIGSPKNLRTSVQVGKPIDARAWMDALVINKKEKRLNKRLESVKEQLNFLRLLEKRMKKLSPEKQRELESLLKEQEQLQQEIAKLSEEKRRLLGGNDTVLEQTPFVQANLQIFPGVVIAMNQFVQEVTSNLRSVKFLLKATGVERKTLL